MPSRARSSSAARLGTARSALTRLCWRAPVVIVRRVYPGAPLPGISDIPLRIAQISDVHMGSGSLSLPAEALDSIVERVQRMEPDVVVLAGDLTASGYEWE